MDFYGFCETNETVDTQILLCDRSGARIGTQFGIPPALWNINLQPAYEGTWSAMELDWFARSNITYNEIRHTDADVFVGVAEPEGTWNLTFWVKNILERGPGDASTQYAKGFNPDYSGEDALAPDTPRYNLTAPTQWGLTFSYNF